MGNGPLAMRKAWEIRSFVERSGCWSSFSRSWNGAFVCSIFYNYPEFWSVRSFDRAGCNSEIPVKPRILVWKKIRAKSIVFWSKIILRISELDNRVSREGEHIP